MALSLVSFVTRVSLAQAFTPGTRETPSVFCFCFFSDVGNAAVAFKGAEGNWEARVPQA